MDKIIQKNFANLLFLTFNDKKIEYLYYKSKYSFAKFLIISILSYLLVILNILLLNIFKTNQDKIEIKNLELIILITEGIIICLYITWKLCIVKLKNEKLFIPVFSVISTMNLFNIYLQPLITTEALKEEVNSVISSSLIPNIHYFFMLVFIIFIEKNHIIYFINFTTSLSISVAFSIGMNWGENVLLSIGIFVGGLAYIFLVYLVNKKEKSVFILYRTAITDLEKKKSFIDNLNSGLIILDDKECDYNLKVKEYLEINLRRNSSEISNFSQSYNPTYSIPPKSTINNYDSFTNLQQKSYNEVVKKLLFSGFKEMNSKLDKNVRDIFLRSENDMIVQNTDEKDAHYKKIINDLLKLMRSNETFQNYFYVGDIVLHKFARRGSSLDDNLINFSHPNNDSSITLRIYLRYNIIAASLEFFLYDISPIIEVENLKASFKYKKLFLNKFSHEFKNPLLNILQLVSNIKKRIKNNNLNLNSERSSKFLGNNLNFKNKSSYSKFSSSSSNYLSSVSHFWVDEIEAYKEVTYVKNLTLYLISLIADFNFISNSKLKINSTTNVKSNINENFGKKSPYSKSLMQYSKFSLSKIIKKCVKIIQTKIDLSDKNISISFWIDENVKDEIYSDPRRLKQVIFNLLSNSFKFTAKGEISIKVTRSDVIKNLIIFEIIDTGIGFRNDIIKKIEEGNRRVLFGNINTNSDIYGIGLGLDLVEKIVYLIGENLKISSTSESGSTVTFSIYDYSRNAKDYNKEHKIKSGYKSSRNLNDNEKYGINYDGDAKIIERSQLRLDGKKTKTRSVSVGDEKIVSINFIESKDKSDLEKYTVEENKIKHRESLFQTDLKNTDGNSKNYIALKIRKKSVEHNRFTSLKEKFDVDVDIDNQTINRGNKNVDSSDFRLDIINCHETSSIKDSETIKEGNTILYDRLIKLNSDEKIEINSDQEFDFEQPPLKIYKIVIGEYKSELEKFIENSVKEDKTKKDIFSNRVVIKNNTVNGNSNKHLKRINILLVDDEKFIRNSQSNQIKKFFKNKKNYEYYITECSDGVECLYKIYKGIQEGIKYDYVISDESMNFLRGTLMIKLLNSLMEEKMMYKIKIFMVTSYEPWAITSTYGEICDGILTKPLSQENLSNIFEF